MVIGGYCPLPLQYFSSSSADSFMTVFLQVVHCEGEQKYYPDASATEVARVADWFKDLNTGLQIHNTGLTRDKDTFRSACSRQ